MRGNDKFSIAFGNKELYDTGVTIESGDGRNACQLACGVLGFR